MLRSIATYVLTPILPLARGMGTIFTHAHTQKLCSCEGSWHLKCHQHNHPQKLKCVGMWTCTMQPAQPSQQSFKYQLLLPCCTYLEISEGFLTFYFFLEPNIEVYGSWTDGWGVGTTSWNVATDRGWQENRNALNVLPKKTFDGQKSGCIFTLSLHAARHL